VAGFVDGWMWRGLSSSVDQKELKNMHKQFRKETLGLISKGDFVDVMRQMGITDVFMQDILFKSFSNKKTGSIGFADLASTLSIITRGTMEEKLTFAFSVLDINGDGAITKDDMTRVMESFCKLVGPQITLSGKKYDRPQQLVDDFFDQIDENRDEKITLEEYMAGAQKNPDIVKGLMLWSTE
jgi:Ca2+-binding EF-hand superfamily protein